MPPAKPKEPALLLPQGMVDPTTLNPHPNNPKLHNEELLAASVAKGVYRAVVVNRGTLTGRPNEILAGHGTRAAWMETHPGELLQVSYVDVDDQRATEILLVDNPNPHDPGFENEALATLLASVAGDMTLTGWNEEDLDTITRIIDATTPFDEDVTDPHKEWWDMPEVPETIDGVKPYRKLIVAFLCEEDVQEFQSRLDQPFTDKAKSIWFPHRDAVLHQKTFRVVGGTDVEVDAATGE